jgi:hypothetical protein
MAEEILRETPVRLRPIGGGGVEMRAGEEMKVLDPESKGVEEEEEIFREENQETGVGALLRSGQRDIADFRSEPGHEAPAGIVQLADWAQAQGQGDELVVEFHSPTITKHEVGYLAKLAHETGLAIEVNLRQDG